MYVVDSHIEFNPVSCYEEMRFNILEDPLYASRGRYLLQNRGMFCWLNSIDMLNSQLSSETLAIDFSVPSCKLRTEEGFRNRLSILLKDIISDIHKEVVL